ncbi:MAG: fibronectin type III domain-containing protein [Gammaproteobacteria bacterium]|nr:fibronectin type III domain-containing protein [Gammaproteobacteria bacterium]
MQKLSNFVRRSFHSLTLLFASVILAACSGGAADSTDNNGGNSTPPTSSEPNQAPSIAITQVPEQAVAGQDLTFTAQASDPEDGDISSAITWESNLDGALGNGATLVAALSAGQHRVTATIFDSDGASQQAAVTLDVAAANQAPQLIIESPQSNGQFSDTSAISFSASAVDDNDGDISATIEWQSNLDGVLGTGAQISRTLSAGEHVISVTVADQSGLQSVLTLNLNVAATYGVATVYWTPPTQNSDGSALTDLAGYKIYYGTDAGNLIDAVTVEDPAANSFLMEQLLVGTTYYFAVSAVNQQGIESDWSEVVSKSW